MNENEMETEALIENKVDIEELSFMNEDESKVDTERRFKRKRRQLEKGQIVYLITEFVKDKIIFKPLIRGEIIRCYSQREAKVWIYSYNSDFISRIGNQESQEIDTDITDTMEILKIVEEKPPETDKKENVLFHEVDENEIFDNIFNKDRWWSEDGKYEGIVLRIKSNNMAIEYNEYEHEEIIIDRENALKIPLFVRCLEKKRRTNEKYGIQGKMLRQFEYTLPELIEEIENEFKSWVNSELQMIEIEDGELIDDMDVYPSNWNMCFTGESYLKFKQMQYDLEMEFAKATGFYYHFLGGTIKD